MTQHIKDCETYIGFDWFMKHMLRDKEDFEILEGFLSVLLNEDVKIAEILESEGNQETESDKFNRVDIKARNSKGHIVIIEVQLSRQLYFLQRILYGVSKTITEHISTGENYDHVKKVYSISLLYCDYGQGEDYVYHGMTRFQGLHTGDDLLINTKEDGRIVMHHPREVFPEYYLLRINAYDQVPKSSLDEWMVYLKTGKVKEDTRTPGLRKVMERLQIAAMTPQQRREYDRHIDSVRVQNDSLNTAWTEGHEEGVKQGVKQGLEQGLEQGVKQGVKQGVEQVARTMLQLGQTDDLILAATGLTASQLADLKSQIG